MEDGILYGLISISIFGVYKLIDKGSNKIVKEKDGITHLRINKSISLLGWLSITLGVVCLTIPFFISEEENPLLMVLMMGSVGIIFIVSGSFFVILYQNHIIEYSETDFTVKSLLNKVKKGQFNQVESIKHNPFTHQFRLKLLNGESIKCSAFFVGFSSFLKKIENEKVKSTN